MNFWAGSPVELVLETSGRGGMRLVATQKQGDKTISVSTLVARPQSLNGSQWQQEPQNDALSVAAALRTLADDLETPPPRNPLFATGSDQ
jgi:hypothetical protein